MRLLLLILAVILVNGFLSNLVWRMIGSKRQEVRVGARIFAALFALANLAAAVLGLWQLYRMGWDWFYILLLLQGVVFAYRFGGATTGNYP